jgi:hypothetical protein
LNLKGKVGWTEGGVLVSLLLFAWLVSAIWIDRYYHAGGPGRRVAYLTMINFCFLVSALLAVVATPHGREQANTIPRVELNSQTSAASGEVAP